jgi:hypothetical protein
VANLWTEFTALHCYAMVKNANVCKMLRNAWWLQLFEKANTYVFAGMVIMNPHPGKFINPNHIGL